MKPVILSKMLADARETQALRMLRYVILAIIGLLVISAQVGLPLGIALSAEEIDEWETDDWRGFWNARLQFLSIRRPGDLPVLGSADFSSITVCQEELIILSSPEELIRFNIRTGRATTSRPPDGVKHVVSDGKQLWWLPGDKVVKSPFLWDGRPRDLIRTEEGLTQVIEFMEGTWQKTEMFVLLPRVSSSDYEFFRSSRCSTTTESFEFLFDDGKYYKVGVALGTKEQADAYARRFNLEEDEVPQLPPGYHSISNLQDDPDYLDYSFGRWFERGAPCAIGVDFDERDTVGFRWRRYEAGKPIESKFVVAPIRWPFDPQMYIRGFVSFAVIIASDGNVYIVTQGHRDYRIHILLWENGTLRLVAQRADPLIWRVCLDVGLFLGLACVVPGILLGALSAIVQHRIPHSVDPGLPPFATVVRRGLARLVDLSLAFLPLALSVVLHSDVMGWWHHVADSLNSVLEALDTLRFDTTLLRFHWFHKSFQEYLGALCQAPFVWPWLVVSVAIGVGQIVWQGRTGRTVGKWLFGIRVVTTTQRPCGLARSLLRELLLFVDSTLLLSWVPGVIAMLSNTKSQRIGDWMADTIVIHERHRVAHPGTCMLHCQPPLLNLTHH
jgi:uncharacterized RDD family membrane protein YckC